MVEKSKLVNKEVEEIIYFLCNCNGGKNWTCKKLKWHGKWNLQKRWKILTYDINLIVEKNWTS